MVTSMVKSVPVIIPCKHSYSRHPSSGLSLKWDDDMVCGMMCWRKEERGGYEGEGGIMMKIILSCSHVFLYNTRINNEISSVGETLSSSSEDEEN